MKYLTNPNIPHEGAKKIDKKDVEEVTKCLTNPNIYDEGDMKIDKNDVEGMTICLTNPDIPIRELKE